MCLMMIGRTGHERNNVTFSAPVIIINLICLLAGVPQDWFGSLSLALGIQKLLVIIQINSLLVS